MLDYNREREDAIRRQVTQRIQRRMLLVLDYALLFFYALIISGRYDIPNLFPMFGVFWFMASIVHTVLVVYWEWMDRALRRALEQERYAYYRAVAETVLAELRDYRDADPLRGEKPKRDQHLRLNADGELYAAPPYLDPDDDEERIYRKRR